MHQSSGAKWRNMDKYLCIFAKTFKSNMVYRSSLFLNIVFQAIYFLLQYYLWRSLIGGGVYMGVTLDDMIFYSMLSTLVMTLSDAAVESDLENEIRDGSVILHFLRPISFKLNCLATTFGNNLYYCITQMLPVYVIGALTIGIPGPASAWGGIGFVVSALLGMLISFEIRYIVGLLAFWIQKTWYLSWYLDFGYVLCGGQLVPLWFFPQVWNAVCYALPFRYISQDAISMYLGITSGAGIALSLTMSVVWLIALMLLERRVWRLAVRKLCVNGG